MLILGGISGAGVLALLEDYRPLLMVVTIAFLGTAFFFTYRPRRAAGGNDGNAPTNKIMAFNKVMLWAVTVIVVVFLFFPHTITNLIAAGDDDSFTADMRLTVLHVEGMT